MLLVLHNYGARGIGLPHSRMVPGGTAGGGGQFWGGIVHGGSARGGKRRRELPGGEVSGHQIFSLTCNEASDEKCSVDNF